ncbi:hypothetical protein KRR40_14930 [Niabella defluvii]|nr:hypothetical protein KRR40_14930 [Niabella sp. I65]
MGYITFYYLPAKYKTVIGIQYLLLEGLAGFEIVLVRYSPFQINIKQLSGNGIIIGTDIIKYNYSIIIGSSPL